METNRYLAKHQLYPFQVTAPPAADIGLTVVIPCYDEPDIVTTLASLWACRRPPCSSEVLIVVNASEADNEAVRRRNSLTMSAAREWIDAHSDPRLRFHLLDYPGLPARHAGVGLARKLGMDEAASRLAAGGGEPAVIVSLDADCTVAPNYLNAVASHFVACPQTPAAAIYFEHPLPAGVQGEAIARYELHLRYYVQGLRHAGSPYAFHTVGSCQAVREQAYVRQGGMNRRQAGEDFYFVQKLIPLGGFSQIDATTVYPSARASHRVPFGTGKAIRDGAGETLLTYSPEVFEALKQLFDRIDDFFRPGAGKPDPLSGLRPSLIEFLDQQRFAEALAEIRSNTGSLASFRKRWFRWFDGFRIMKYANFASREAHPKLPVEQAAREMLAHYPVPRPVDDVDLGWLLNRYRTLDRQAGRSPCSDGP